MSPNAIEARAAPLEKLLASLLEERSQLEFGASLLPGRTNFTVSAPASVIGRLVGWHGTHLRSLQVIAEVIGQQMGQQWVLTLADPEDERRGPKRRAPMPTDHDPSDASLLMQDVLEAAGINAHVTVRGAIAGGFDFTVEAETQHDVGILLDPMPAIYTPGQLETRPMNFMAALAIIFKAIGLANGVTYRVESA